MDVLERSYDQALEEQAQIWNCIFSFMRSMSLKCAVELRVADAIHKHGGQPITLHQLASAIGIPVSKVTFLHRLMRLLTHFGFFASRRIEGEDVYLLTGLSKHLLVENPQSACSFILAMLHPGFLEPWQLVSKWFFDDSPTPFYHLNGNKIWEVVGGWPDLNETFNDSMVRDSRLIISMAISKFPQVFHGLKSLVDVGGGHGATTITLAKAFPEMKCMVLDLPHVVASAPKNTTVDFVVGDMFKSIPPANAILMKWIFHDLQDEDCLKLLARCKEAIPPREEGGKVIVVDIVTSKTPERHETVDSEYFMDMLMMVTIGGKERGEEEWQKLVHDAGFSGLKIVGDLGVRSIIEIYP